MMSEIQQLMDRMPLAQIAQQAGVDQGDAQRALEAVLPALVGGMQANAQDAAGAASLEQALSQHRGALDGRLGGDVDADDGARIVQNIFGGQTDQIATALGGSNGALGEIIRKVLPIVAPIVLAWLAEKLFSGGGRSASNDGVPQQAPQGGQTQLPTGGDNPFGNSGGGAGRGSLPTGGAQPQAQQPQQPAGDGGLGDLLGGILGGGGAQGGSGNILGDLLGGLLGGGRR